jgi:hypothetical protein
MKGLLAGLLISAVMALGFVAAPVQAASQAPLGNVAATCRGGVAAFLGFRSWDSCLPLDARGVPQITKLNDFWLIVLVIVEDILKASAYLAVGFIVWGGVKYTKSQGDPGEVQQARQIIHNALFGLVIVVISISIVTFITGAFN